MVLNTSVEFDNHRIFLLGKALSYDAYYIRMHAEETSTVYVEVMRNTFRQWAAALASLQPEETLLLPFSLDDEWTECLAAQLLDGQIALRYVRAEVNGYQIDLTQLQTFMRENHRTSHSAPEDFGVFSQRELVDALNAATEITTGGADIAT